MTVCVFLTILPLNGSIMTTIMIITCSKLISFKSDKVPINNGAIVINRGMIEAVGTFNRITQRYPHHSVVNLQRTVLMPGLINTHTHIELPDVLNKIRTSMFTDWILNLIRLKKRLTKIDYATAAKENIRTLIRTGTTTVGEICTHGVSPEILKKSEIRSVIFHEIINMTPMMRENISSKLKIQCSMPRLSALMRTGISPHALYTVSKPILLQVKNIAEQRNLKISMHIAESADELRLLHGEKSGLDKLYHFIGWDLDWAPKGSSSFAYLDNAGLLSPLLLAVHAVHVTDKDITLIKKSNVSIAHCPRSNKELGVGIMPLKKFLDTGITVGLGTDSLASSPNLSMWDEMRYAHRTHRRKGITPHDIFRLATISGAKALGLAEEIGTIEPGKKADIIAIPLPSKNTGDLYSDLLRETKSCIMTMVNGKILHRTW